MSDPVGFIINAGAGVTPGAHGDWVDAHLPRLEQLAAGGPVARVHGGDEITAAVDAALARGCRTLVAGGGDGTINAVASRLVGRPERLGVLPLGTLNHFARDLGVPPDPTQALEALVAGVETQVDVGEVNGHFFLNNSSLGLYPHIVRDREHQQRRFGRSKWRALASASWNALRRFPFVKVRLSVDGADTWIRTPFVFIGNNAYRLEGFDAGARDDLRDGTMCIHLAREATRWQLVVMAVRALAGRLHQAPGLLSYSVSEACIETRHHSLAVATDGEVRRLAGPFHYKLHARALRVLVPASAAGSASASPAA